jgi:hypothetical protein
MPEERPDLRMGFQDGLTPGQENQRAVMRGGHEMDAMVMG